jgi:hypothetical protein
MVGDAEVTVAGELLPFGAFGTTVEMIWITLLEPQDAKRGRKGWTLIMGAPPGPCCEGRRRAGGVRSRSRYAPPVVPAFTYQRWTEGGYAQVIVHQAHRWDDVLRTVALLLLLW